MSNKVTYSIVVPVFNAAQSLESLVTKIQNVFIDITHYEILLVDDGSKDESWEKIRNLRTKFPEVVKGLRLSRNFGQHNATLCGILNSTGNWIVTIDDDLQSSPDDIKKLIESAQNGDVDIVYGIHKNSKHGIIKSLLSKLYKVISRLDEKSNSEGSSFRLLKGDLRQNLVNHQTHFLFLDELILWYTTKISYVEVQHFESKKSNYTYKKLFGLSTNLIIYSSDIHLRAITTIGFLIAFINGLLGIYYLIHRFIDKTPMGFTTIIIAVLFSTGLIVYCLGVIAFYIGQVYRQNNHQPSFKISETL